MNVMMAPGDTNEYDSKKTISETFTSLKDKLELEEFASIFERISTKSLEINNVFLQTKQRIGEIKRAVADTIPGIARLGGDIEGAVKTIASVSEATKRNVLISKETASELYATGRLLNQEVETLVKAFRDVGMESAYIGETMEESINYLQNIGLNSGQIMGTVLEHAEQLNRYQFEGGVKGLTKMAAQAAMLNVDMTQTFQLAEKVLNPENAVEIASAFQRLGVAAGNLTDPFSLMNQSINDPSGLQDSLANVAKQFTYFDEKTNSFKINPQGVLTLKQMEEEAGLASGTLSKMGLAAAEFDERISQISPSIQFKDEEDKMLLANIGRMGEGGQYQVEVTDKEGKSFYKNFADLTQEEFDKLLEEQKNAPKTVEDIQRSQLKVTEKLESDVNAIRLAVVGGIVTADPIVEAQKFGEKVYDATIGAITESKITSTELSRDMVNDVLSPFQDMISDLFKGEKDFSTIMKESGKGFMEALDSVYDTLVDMGDDIGIKIEEKIKKEDPQFYQKLLTFLGIKDEKKEDNRVSDADKKDKNKDKKVDNNNLSNNGGRISDKSTKENENNQVKVVVTENKNPPTPTPTPVVSLSNNNLNPNVGGENTNTGGISNVNTNALVDALKVVGPSSVIVKNVVEQPPTVPTPNIDNKVGIGNPSTPPVSPVDLLNYKPVGQTEEVNQGINRVNAETSKIDLFNILSDKMDKIRPVEKVSILPEELKSLQLSTRGKEEGKIDMFNMFEDKMNELKQGEKLSIKPEEPKIIKLKGEEKKTEEIKDFKKDNIQEFINSTKEKLEEQKKVSYVEKKPLGEMLIKGKENYLESLSKTAEDVRLKNAKIDISGIVTVDVKLPAEFNQLDKTQMKQLFSAAFNHPNFKQFVYTIARHEDEKKSPNLVEYTPG